MHYLYVHEGELYLVESEIGAVLTMRLLVYAVHGESKRVIGLVDNITWLGESNDRSSNVVRLSFFVEPNIFSNEGSKLWTLLHKEDAKRLHKHWENDSKYKTQVIDKTNYFKNAVDHFKHQMETVWYKQTK